jgi:hypothetical protein
VFESRRGRHDKNSQITVDMGLILRYNRDMLALELAYMADISANISHATSLLHGSIGVWGA